MKNISKYQNLSDSRSSTGLRSSSAAVALILASSFLPSSQVDAAVSLIDADFSSGSLSGNARIRTNQSDGTFYTDNSPTTDWEIGGGVLSNAGTSLTGGTTEGALSQVIDTSGYATDLTSLTLSFDYTVGATATLKFALIGYTANILTTDPAQSPTNTLLMNNGTANGALQNNTQAELRQGDINLFTGADMTQSITSDLTFAAGTSGSYSGTFDLSAYSWHADEAAGASPANSPGLSGSITSIADFDYVVLVAVNDLSSDIGVTATTLDNINLTAAAVPEPSSTALLGLGGLALILRRRK
ncbi:MAG: PEP-CTERM sorting domain-containing protein [Akkermansiaceae bacterium]